MEQVQTEIYLNEIHSAFDRQVMCSVRRTSSKRNDIHNST